MTSYVTISMTFVGDFLVLWTLIVTFLFRHDNWVCSTKGYIVKQKLNRKNPLRILCIVIVEADLQSPNNTVLGKPMTFPVTFWWRFSDVPVTQ